MSSRWDRFTDFGTDARPVRQKLLRRIQSGQVCGFISETTQRPCLATPIARGRYCCRHDKTQHLAEYQAELAKRKVTPATVLSEALGAFMSPEDAQTLNEIYEYGPIVLDDQIGLLRLRIMNLEKTFRDGFITVAEYHRDLLALTDSLRKLTETNSKLALNAALANRFASDDAPEDKFNPLAEDDSTETAAIDAELVNDLPEQ